VSRSGKGTFGHGNSLFVESIAVPLVVRYPAKIPAGRRSDALVGIVDIAPTILELAGAPPLPDITGESLVPLLDSPEASRPAVAVSELNVRRKSLNQRVIRSGDWKLLVDLESRETVGLWNIAEDPGEKKNLVGEGHEPNAEVRGVLRRTDASIRRLARLHRLRKNVEPAPMPEEVEDSLRNLGYIGDDE